MTSIFEGQPPKTNPFPIQTRVIWVPGTYTGITTCPPKTWTIKVKNSNNSSVKELHWEGSSFYDYARKGVIIFQTYRTIITESSPNKQKQIDTKKTNHIYTYPAHQLLQALRCLDTTKRGMNTLQDWYEQTGAPPCSNGRLFVGWESYVTLLAVTS